MKHLLRIVLGLASILVCTVIGSFIATLISFYPTQFFIVFCGLGLLGISYIFGKVIFE